MGLISLRSPLTLLHLLFGFTLFPSFPFSLYSHIFARAQCLGSEDILVLPFSMDSAIVVKTSTSCGKPFTPTFTIP